MRAGIKEPTVGIAPQFGDRMQLETDDFSNVLLFRKVAVHAVICDALGQARTLRAQLLFVEINASLFLLSFRAALAWRRLCDGERQSATACHIHDRQGRNLQTPLGAIGAAVEEVTETESLLAALRKERGILRRDQFRARVERRSHDALRKVWPIKGSPELTRNRALGVVAVAAQVAKVDAPPQREDRREQSGQELPLRLTNRRHLLQNVVDNCHRPFTG